MTGGAIVSGVGETEYIRGTEQGLEDFAVRACRAACDDAGVDPREVDGVVVAGFRGRVEDIAGGLQLSDLAFSSRIEMGGASSVAGIVHAVAAVESGRARHVLVSAVRLGYSMGRLGKGGDSVIADLTRFFPGEDLRVQLEHPYGVLVPMQYYALQATRWLDDHDLEPEAMAPVAVTMREHAQLNPRAVMRDRELTPEMYAHSPVIASPFRILDCCIETDGAAAVIVSAGDLGRGDSRPQVRVAAAAEAHADSPDDIVSRSDLPEIGLTKASRRAFEEAGIGPDALDFAEIYDCFTYTVLRQLEELGACGHGESVRFVADGGIRRDGVLPVNTHGGLLSEAHVLGMNHVVEGVRQVRGDAGPTQLEGVTWGAVTGYGDFGDAGLILLTNR